MLKLKYMNFQTNLNLQSTVCTVESLFVLIESFVSWLIFSKICDVNK